MIFSYTWDPDKPQRSLDILRPLIDPMPSFPIALFATTLFLPITSGAVWSFNPRHVSLLSEPCLSSVYTPVTSAVCLSGHAAGKIPAVVQSQSRSVASSASTLNPRPPASGPIVKRARPAGAVLGHEHFGPTPATSPVSKPASTLTATSISNPVLATPMPPPTSTSVPAGAPGSSVPPNEGGTPNPNNGSGPTATNFSVDVATNPTAAAGASSSSSGATNLNGGSSSTPARSPLATSVPAGAPTSSALATSVPAGAPTSSGGAANPDGGSGSPSTQSPLATSVPTGAPATSGGANTKGGSGPARWMHLITFGAAMAVLVHCI
ncbi:hypothetical protein K438DRAFT_1868923 [Mycena galopus ATCC 62051]|nr:hypothetical protein K438DRAFT_1868923 [Mycena galopus ATCC 62051]